MKTQMMILKIVVPLFIAALSIFVLADKVSEAKFVENSVESIENSKTTVMEFTGATLAASLAISALPDDFASPLADSLADMDSYFVIILMALFIERLILVSGVDAVFLYVIPVACGQIEYQIVNEEPEPPARQNNFVKMVMMALAKDPQRRPLTSKSLIEGTDGGTDRVAKIDDASVSHAIVVETGSQSDSVQPEVDLPNGWCIFLIGLLAMLFCIIVIAVLR